MKYAVIFSFVPVIGVCLVALAISVYPGLLGELLVSANIHLLFAFDIFSVLLPFVFVAGVVLSGLKVLTEICFTPRMTGISG